MNNGNKTEYEDRVGFEIWQFMNNSSPSPRYLYDSI